MLERVAELTGQELKLDDYFEDFEARFWQVGSSWKLERCQVFQEPDVPSWAAMADGDRARSLALADEMRDGIAEHQRRLDAHGIVQRRLRIVELPLSDYLWWELYVLRIRADLGERIRVLPPSAVASWETFRPLPEIIVLGEHTTYQVRYDGDGIVTGAKLLADPEVTTACTAEMAVPWRQGEDLVGFLTRTGVLTDTRESSTHLPSLCSIRGLGTSAEAPYQAMPRSFPVINGPRTTTKTMHGRFERSPAWSSGNTTPGIAEVCDDLQLAAQRPDVVGQRGQFGDGSLFDR